MSLSRRRLLACADDAGKHIPEPLVMLISIEPGATDEIVPGLLSEPGVPSAPAVGRMRRDHRHVDKRSDGRAGAGAPSVSVELAAASMNIATIVAARHDRGPTF